MRATMVLSRASKAARCSGVDRSCPSSSRVHKHVEQRARPPELLFEGLRALLAHEVVGVEAAGQECEAHAEARLQVRQHGLDRAERGLAAGRIAVEAEDRLGRQAPQKRHLLLGERGAERRHRLGKARLGERDHVHVAFDRDDAGLVVRGPARAVTR